MFDLEVATDLRNFGYTVECNSAVKVVAGCIVRITLHKSPESLRTDQYSINIQQAEPEFIITVESVTRKEMLFTRAELMISAVSVVRSKLAEIDKFIEEHSNSPVEGKTNESLPKNSP